MNYIEIGVFDKVKWKQNGEIYTVSRKRTGVDLYEICKVEEWYESGSPKIVTDIHDGIISEELEFIERGDK